MLHTRFDSRLALGFYFRPLPPRRIASASQRVSGQISPLRLGPPNPPAVRSPEHCSRWASWWAVADSTLPCQESASDPIREWAKKSRRGWPGGSVLGRIVRALPSDGIAALPSSLFVDTSLSFIHWLTVPLRYPRTECANQPVAFISSFSEAPSGRLRRPNTFATLLPSRAPVAGLSCLAAFWLLGGRSAEL